MDSPSLLQRPEPSSQQQQQPQQQHPQQQQQQQAVASAPTSAATPGAMPPPPPPPPLYQAHPAAGGGAGGAATGMAPAIGSPGQRFESPTGGRKRAASGTGDGGGAVAVGKKLKSVTPLYFSSKALDMAMGAVEEFYLMHRAIGEFHDVVASQRQQGASQQVTLLPAQRRRVKALLSHAENIPLLRAALLALLGHQLRPEATLTRPSTRQQQQQKQQDLQHQAVESAPAANSGGSKKLKSATPFYFSSKALDLALFAADRFDMFQCCVGDFLDAVASQRQQGASQQPQVTLLPAQRRRVMVLLPHADGVPLLHAALGELLRHQPPPVAAQVRPSSLQQRQQQHSQQQATASTPAPPIVPAAPPPPPPPRQAPPAAGIISLIVQLVAHTSVGLSAVDLSNLAVVSRDFAKGVALFWQSSLRGHPAPPTAPAAAPAPAPARPRPAKKPLLKRFKAAMAVSSGDQKRGLERDFDPAALRLTTPTAPAPANAGPRCLALIDFADALREMGFGLDAARRALFAGLFNASLLDDGQEAGQLVRAFHQRFVQAFGDRVAAAPILPPAVMMDVLAMKEGRRFHEGNRRAVGEGAHGNLVVLKQQTVVTTAPDADRFEEMELRVGVHYARDYSLPIDNPVVTKQFELVQVLRDAGIESKSISLLLRWAAVHWGCLAVDQHVELARLSEFIVMVKDYLAQHGRLPDVPSPDKLLETIGLGLAPGRTHFRGHVSGGGIGGSSVRPELRASCEGHDFHVCFFESPERHSRFEAVTRMVFSGGGGGEGSGSNIDAAEEQHRRSMAATVQGLLAALESIPSEPVERQLAALAALRRAARGSEANEEAELSAAAANIPAIWRAHGGPPRLARSVPAVEARIVVAPAHHVYIDTSARAHPPRSTAELGAGHLVRVLKARGKEASAAK